MLSHDDLMLITGVSLIPGRNQTGYEVSVVHSTRVEDYASTQRSGGCCTKEMKTAWLSRVASEKLNESCGESGSALMESITDSGDTQTRGM